MAYEHESEVVREYFERQRSVARAARVYRVSAEVVKAATYFALGFVLRGYLRG